MFGQATLYTMINTKESYREKLLDPRWQKKRAEILQRDDYTCQHCGDTKSTLHIHHIQYNNCDPWDIGDFLLETVCESCHIVQHSGLTHLEKFLLTIIHNRDKGQTDLIQGLNKAIIGIKNKDPYYKDFK